MFRSDHIENKYALSGVGNVLFDGEVGFLVDSVLIYEVAVCAIGVTSCWDSLNLIRRLRREESDLICVIQ
jgi:hypothetical protein